MSQILKNTEVNFLKKFLLIIGRENKNLFIKYLFTRLSFGFVDAIYIVIVSFIYSALKNEGEINSNSILTSFPLLIFFVLTYILIFVFAQRFVINLDCKFASKIKKRILDTFDLQTYQNKAKYDQGTIASILGPTFDLFHNNALSSFGGIFQAIGNLIVLLSGSFFLLGWKVILALSFILTITFTLLIFLKPRQLKLAKIIKEGQQETMQSIYYYLRLLEKLKFLPNLNKSITDSIYFADIKIRRGLGKNNLTSVYSKSILDFLILTTIIILIFGLKITSSNLLIIILISIRILPVFQQLINFITRITSSASIISNIYDLVSNLKISNIQNNNFLYLNNNSLLSIKGSKNIDYFKTNFTDNSKKNELILDVSKYKRYSIIGSSGVGKSTFLKSIAGLNNSFKVLPFKIKSKLPKKIKLMMVPQEPQLLKGSALFNITTESDLNKVNLKQLKEAVRISEFLFDYNDPNLINLLDRVSISDDGQGLSGGERQRLILAQSIYLCPDLLLIDEGLCSLTKKVSNRISTKLYNSKIPCIIYVSHNDLDLDLWSNTIEITKN